MLLKKKKKKKREFYRERVANLSKRQKQKLVEYRINYHIVHNKKLLSLLIRFF